MDAKELERHISSNNYLLTELIFLKYRASKNAK